MMRQCEFMETDNNHCQWKEQEHSELLGLIKHFLLFTTEVIHLVILSFVYCKNSSPNSSIGHQLSGRMSLTICTAAAKRSLFAHGFSHYGAISISQGLRDQGNWEQHLWLVLARPSAAFVDLQRCYWLTLLLSFHKFKPVILSLMPL